MLLSGLMFLEASLHYPTGAGFDTLTRDLLGRRWNLINGASIAFVLGILTYAYISASGAILQHTFASLGMPVSARIAGLGFTLLVALFVWLGTAVVSRVTLIFLGAKVITFFLLFGGLLGHVKPALLFPSGGEEARYLRYLWMVVPFALPRLAITVIFPASSAITSAMAKGGVLPVAGYRRRAGDLSGMDYRHHGEYSARRFYRHCPARR